MIPQSARMRQNRECRSHPIDMTNDENAWKIFKRDTEAGRLLSRLYGVPPSSQRVSYPKQRRRKRLTDAGNTDNVSDGGNESQTKVWKTTYCVHGWKKEEEEEHEKERQIHRARALSLAVPKVGRGKFGLNVDGHNSNAKVDHIPRRKTELKCKSTIRDYNFVNKKYRPPVSHARGDEEKQRLNDAFGRNGGKCLPEDLTHPPAMKSSGDSTSSEKPPQPDSLFDQIYQEILERREHQMAMEKMGAGEATRELTANEIKIRLQHLKKIDSGRATEIINKLMK